MIANVEEYELVFWVLLVAAFRMTWPLIQAVEQPLAFPVVEVAWFEE